MDSRSLIMEIDSILSNADRAEAYLQLCERFMTGTDEFRDFVRLEWDFGADWEFPMQERLSCRVGETRPCRDRIEASLLYFAIAIENDRDSRDDLVAFSVIYHSCVAACIDPTELFRKVAKLATPGVAKSMRDFVARSAADRSLSAFLLIKDVNSDGEVEIRPDWAGGA